MLTSKMLCSNISLLSETFRFRRLANERVCIIINDVYLMDEGHLPHFHLESMIDFS